MKVRTHHYLLKFLRRGRVLKRFIKDELRQQGDGIKMFMKLTCLFHGFNSSKAKLFGFEGNRYSDFYSDFERNKVRKFNKVHGLLLDRKDIFHTQMARLELGPKVVGTIIDGCFYQYGSSDPKSFDELLSECQSQALLRPIKNTGFSRTLRYVHEHNDIKKIRELGSTRKNSAPIESLLKGHWQVIEGLPRGSLNIPHAIVPYGTDSVLRVTTLKSTLTGNVSPIFSFLSCVSDGSKEYIEVELDQGMLTEKVLVNNGGQVSRENLRAGAVALVGFDEALAKAVKAHQALPNLNAVSWWMVKTNSGWAIVNGTNKLDTHIAQIFRPCKKKFLDFGWV